MFNDFKQYKNQDFLPGIDLEAGFASMSKTTYPHLAGQIDKTIQLHQQLAIVEAKYASLQQQVEMAKSLLDNSSNEKSEKELIWLNMMYSHLNLVLSKYYETKILPLKAQIWRMHMEFDAMKK